MRAGVSYPPLPFFYLPVPAYLLSHLLPSFITHDLPHSQPYQLSPIIVCNTSQSLCLIQVTMREQTSPSASALATKYLHPLTSNGCGVQMRTC